jgi:hypothetical protein
MNECELLHNFTHKEAVFAVDMNTALVVTGSADRVKYHSLIILMYRHNKTW